MLIRLTQSSRASSEEERAEHDDDNVDHVHLEKARSRWRGRVRKGAEILGQMDGFEVARMAYH